MPGNPHHINILEAAAQSRLARRKALLGGPCRYSALIGSYVATCALAKGCSLSHEFCAAPLPFRLLPASTAATLSVRPDRCRPTVESPPIVDGANIRSLASLPRMRRWAANWVRLLLRLARGWTPARHTPSHLMDFDSSPGFPGEGVWIVLSGLGLGLGSRPCEPGRMPWNAGPPKWC